MRERTLLAILGRGIQRTVPGGLWDLTEGIEVCDEKFAHLPVRVPQDDDHPNSIVGGGWLNLLAGLELAKKLSPDKVVCAYGFRSAYLKSIDAPSESEVMSRAYHNIGGPRPNIFGESVWWEIADRPSNTNQEIDNIFSEAIGSRLSNVAIVTVSVHVARSLLMAQRHLSREKFYEKIKLQFYASENVLIEADPAYEGRCRKLMGSKSFQRNFQLEQRGINALLSGKYNSVQSTITPKA